MLPSSIIEKSPTWSPTSPSEGVSRARGRVGGWQDSVGQNSAEFHAPPPPTIRRPDEDVGTEKGRKNMLDRRRRGEKLEEEEEEGKYGKGMW